MEGLASRLILGTGLSGPSLNPSVKFLPLKTHNHIQHLHRSSLTTSITTKTHQQFTPIRSFHAQFNKACFAFSRLGLHGQSSTEGKGEEEQQVKIGKTGILVAVVVFTMLGLQGRFCRPALADPSQSFPDAIQQEVHELAKAYIAENRNKTVGDVKKQFRKIIQEKKKGFKKKTLDPEYVESKAKELTNMLIETFPELQSQAKNIKRLNKMMKQILPCVEESDHKRLVDSMPKFWVYLMARNGEFNRALMIVDRMIEKEPHSDEWLHLKELVLNYVGRKELEADKAEEARMHFEQLVEMQPFNPRALQELAMAKHNLGEDAAMIQMLEERVQKAKEVGSHEDVYNMKLLVANAYVVQGNLEEALKHYQRLTDENPKDYKSYLAQGIIYSVLDRKDEAEEQFDKYREFFPVAVPDEGFLDNVVEEALAEGHKFFEEKKEKATMAQKEGPRT